MTIEIRQPELERLMEEEILSGHFQSMDEFLTEAIKALREKNAPPAPASRARQNLERYSPQPASETLDGIHRSGYAFHQRPEHWRDSQKNRASPAQQEAQRA